MRKLGIAEMLKMIDALPDYEARRISLSTCKDNTPLVGILQYMFHPDVTFNLPHGIPPFKLNEYVDQQSNLYREFRRLYLFMNVPSAPNLTKAKREQHYIQFLETIDKDDAVLILGMKDKTSPYKNITYQLVYEAFPGILPDPATVDFSKFKIEEEKPKVPYEKNVDLERACPFGCTTKTGKTFMMPGPLVKHLKYHHHFTDEQVEQFKKEQY